MTRIIAGEKRGTILQTLEGDRTRPTTDRVREALFGCIQFEIAGANVLDLFAGSGALGLEALSRGAACAVFCDRYDETVKIIKGNIAKLGYETRSQLIKNDYIHAIKVFQNTEKFDIVLIDPPYKSGYYETVLELLARENVLKHGAILVAESEEPVEAAVDGYHVYKNKRYGKTFLTFFRWDKG
ncbi:MAG: 16S rRNA (guanine(966)-N(2))-methyltransferase RsmD [Christensenella sp.]|uniref:16S rRNA (guanine(966)-N(2))-methyltransferase RsmD n=1 Tax=Christensenella sp. TaxID=1935934 RepID=UPI002B2103EA|nr:16S rRNA (guanine(966)-N(2))-methyltransferase RsmD [Christensenella sp.]MEA5003715.1 16S rRNA (guanine(966)-N(2))-methyltransferase RsmD [Christensenella sp.]